MISECPAHLRLPAALICHGSTASQQLSVDNDCNERSHRICNMVDNCCHRCHDGSSSMHFSALRGDYFMHRHCILKPFLIAALSFETGGPHRVLLDTIDSF